MIWEKDDNDILTARPQYRITDHLGNSMVFFDDKDSDGRLITEVDVAPSGGYDQDDLEVIQRLYYYPFGMHLEGIGQLGAEPGQLYRYNGKEYQEDIGLYDYGARYYDPAIARWGQVDPHADSYPTMSPYSALANNPLIYVDPDGRDIIIKANKKDHVKYENGTLTDARTGGAYTGKGVKIRKDGSVKLKGFLKRAVSALEDIRSGGASGNSLISNLETDSNNFIIRKGSSNQTVGRDISFDPSSREGGPDENGDTSRPAFIGLAHEIGHAIDNDRGTTDMSTWETMSDGTTIPSAEKYGMHVENMVRGENDLALREFYTTDKKIGVGRAIQKGTRKSATYGRYISSLKKKLYFSY